MRKGGRSTALVFSMQVSGVCLPEVVVIERDGTGLVGRAVVQQAAVHNELPVRAVQTESERIWGEIAVKMHRASVMLPTFEPCKTLLQGLVAERRGVFLRFAKPFLAFDYHIVDVV